MSLISGRKLKTKTPWDPGMVHWSQSIAKLHVRYSHLHSVKEKRKKRGERRLKRIFKPSQKRLNLIGCLLSQKFDKTLMHHLTLNGFSKAVIGLNIPMWEERQKLLIEKVLLPNSHLYTYIWPCSCRAWTEHLLSPLQPIKVKSWNLMCLNNRSYKRKSKCVPNTS